jgi:hypothetical protein
MHYRREEVSRQRSFGAFDVKQSQDDIPPELHHYISASRNKPLPLVTFIQEKPEDPAEKVYL